MKITFCEGVTQAAADLCHILGSKVFTVAQYLNQQKLVDQMFFTASCILILRSGN